MGLIVKSTTNEYFTFSQEYFTLEKMPKKNTIKKAKKGHSLRIAILLFGLLIFAIGLAAFFYPKTPYIPVCANSISCVKDLSGKPEKTTKGFFMGTLVTAPQTPETPSYEIAQERAVLGDNTSNNKHIYVDLAHQRLTAYEGNNLFMDVPISSGRWHPTPTGDFHIWVWLRATRMTGGSGADYYDLPNVPFTMFFYNEETPKAWGFSLHGTYWHNNFGHPMSHGCVNMRITDAEKLFYWSNPAIQGWSTYADGNSGTLITIYGTAPVE